jgi:hypothetical protein
LVERLSSTTDCNTSRQVDVLNQLLIRQGNAAGNTNLRGFSASERFLIVCPASQSYMNPVRLGDDPTVFGLLSGCAGVFIGDRLITHDWDGPIYAAGERSAPNPPGVVTATSANTRRNLYGMALAEYQDVTYRDIFPEDDIFSEFRSELVRNAMNNDGVLFELGNAVDCGGLTFLEADLIRQFGTDWRMKLESVYRKRHPPVQPSWLQHNGRLVEKIAWVITLEDRYDDLGILADALEDAGCNNADILQHCRSPREHARECACGCWVVDAILQERPQ